MFLESTKGRTRVNQFSLARGMEMRLLKGALLKAPAKHRAS